MQDILYHSVPKCEEHFDVYIVTVIPKYSLHFPDRSVARYSSFIPWYQVLGNPFRTAVPLGGQNTWNWSKIYSGFCKVHY